MRGTERRLLVYRPGALGDTLLALPALRAAQIRFRADWTVFAGHASVVPLVRANGLADLVCSADDARLLPLFSGDNQRLSAGFGRLTSAVLWGGLTLLSAAEALRSAGVDVLHAPSQPPSRDTGHVSTYLVRSIDPHALMAPKPLRLTPPAQDLAAIDHLLERVGDGHVLAIHPGSGSGEKNWRVDGFATVANLARRRLGVSIAILGGPADQELVRDVLALLDEPPEILVHDWPLTRVAALLTRAQVYLGNDSGISHLAGCLGVRGLALFGPTDPVLWAPLGESIRVLRQPTMAEHHPEQVMCALEALVG